MYRILFLIAARPHSIAVSRLFLSFNPPGFCLGNTTVTTKGKLRCLEQRDDDDDYADGWFGKTDYESEKFDISQRWGFRSFGKKAMLVFRESALLMCLRCGR